MAKALTFRIDTGYSGEVGSVHDVLLENSWFLSRGLQTTRRLLSTPAMIPGHYRPKSTIFCAHRLALSRGMKDAAGWKTAEAVPSRTVIYPSIHSPPPRHPRG